MVELRHFRYFVAVAEELHFGRAAARLGMTQPPLSRQIRQLEDEVGAPVFERTGKGVVLTSAGRALLDEARRALEQADRAVVSARRAASGETGALAIGYDAGCLHTARATAALRRFRASRPGVEVTLQLLSPTGQAEALAAGAIDAGITQRGSVVGPGVSRLPIVEERMGFVLPRAGALNARPERRLADLAGTPLITAPRSYSPVVHDRHMAACARGGYFPPPAPRVDSLSTALALVSAGMGVALAGPSSAYGLPPDLVIRPVLDFDVETGSDLVWRAGDPSPIVRALATAVREGGPDPGDQSS